MKTVTVIVATHQGRRFMKRCLTALEKTRLPTNWQLQSIVVDNGSTDDTEGFLKAHFPRVERIIFAGALGFAGANNAARTSSRGDIVVFLNNDTEVTPDWLLRPIELLESDPRVAAVGSRLDFMHNYRRCQLVAPEGGRVAVSTAVFGNGLDPKVRWSPDVSEPVFMRGGNARWVPAGASVFVPDPIDALDVKPARPPMLTIVAVEGHPTAMRFQCGDRELPLSSRVPQVRAVPEVDARVRLIQAAGGFINRTGDAGDFGAAEVVEEIQLEETSVPTLCGASLIVRRSALDEAGWLPEAYVVYYEDTHLNVRLRENGGLLVFCPSSVVRHFHTGTNREHSPFFIENVSRSRLIFSAYFGKPQLLARRLFDQLASGVRVEILGAAHPSWRNAHGLRGMVKSLPTVSRVTLNRLLRGELRGGHSQLEQLSIERTPYHSAGEGTAS